MFCADWSDLKNGNEGRKLRLAPGESRQKTEAAFCRKAFSQRLAVVFALGITGHLPAHFQIRADDRQRHRFPTFCSRGEHLWREMGRVSLLPDVYPGSELLEGIYEHADSRRFDPAVHVPDSDYLCVTA
uniref:Predicted protein n=1 Tax=Physcomitrium patens TaxID=3218 RepID=A9U897_PHYPA